MARDAARRVILLTETEDLPRSFQGGVPYPESS